VIAAERSNGIGQEADSNLTISPDPALHSPQLSGLRPSSLAAQTPSIAPVQLLNLAARFGVHQRRWAAGAPPLPVTLLQAESDAYGAWRRATRLPFRFPNNSHQASPAAPKHARMNAGQQAALGAVFISGLGMNGYLWQILGPPP